MLFKVLVVADFKVNNKERFLQSALMNNLQY